MELRLVTHLDRYQWNWDWSLDRYQWNWDWSLDIYQWNWDWSQIWIDINGIETGHWIEINVIETGHWIDINGIETGHTNMLLTSLNQSRYRTINWVETFIKCVLVYFCYNLAKRRKASAYHIQRILKEAHFLQFIIYNIAVDTINTNCLIPLLRPPKVPCINRMFNC